MIRATTGGVLRTYRRNLMNSFIAQNKASETIQTHRNFNSYAEDPAAAAKAFRLRKSRMMADSQYKICNDTYYKYQAAFTSLESISLKLDNDTGEYMNTIKGCTLEWLDDPKGDAREQLAKVLDQMSESIIQNLNQTYGGKFIFAGADGHNVPFEVRTDAAGVKQLYYRGVPVDAAEPKLMKDSTSANVTMPNGDYVLADATIVEQLPNLEPAAAPATGSLTVTMNGKSYYVEQGAASSAAPPAAPANPADYSQVELADGTKVYYETAKLIDKADYDEKAALMDKVIKDNAGNPQAVTIDGKTCYVLDDGEGTMTQADYDEACLDAEKLKYLQDEKLFVDIGLGFQENENGKLIESSAYNAALNGINFIGCGLDEDGDPKNIYSLVQRLKELSDSVPEGGSWSNVWPEFDRLVGKLETASSDFHTAFVNMDASTTKLGTNLELLDENSFNLTQEYAGLEDVNDAEAISAFLWAQYSYNAALKVGNSILSQSLMDYLT